MGWMQSGLELELFSGSTTEQTSEEGLPNGAHSVPLTYVVQKTAQLEFESWTRPQGRSMVSLVTAS